MFPILSSSYKQTRGKDIVIANLGQSTKNFGFFVTSTISNSVSSTSSLQSKFLINKLISLTSEEKYELIDSVISKVKSFEPKEVSEQEIQIVKSSPE